MLEASAFESLYGGQISSSTQLIKPNIVPTTPSLCVIAIIGILFKDV